MTTYKVLDTHNDKIIAIYRDERAAYKKREKLEERRREYGAMDGVRYEVVYESRKEVL